MEVHDKITIVINSSSTYLEALTHLIDSIKTDLRYKKYKFIVFISGHYELPDYVFETIDNITYVKCNYSSIDLTSLVALSELYSNDVENMYLVLLDTCKVGNKFFDIIEKMNFENITSIKINKKFSNNIGFYSQALLNQNKTFLQSIKRNEKIDVDFKKLISSFEDIIFKNDENNVLLDDYDDWQYTGPTDYYNTGTMRIVEYYPNLDLYRIKANWGWWGNWSITI